MFKSALAVVYLACTCHARRVQHSLQSESELAAAFNPSSAGTRVSVGSSTMTGSHPEVLDGRKGLNQRVPLTQMAPLATVIERPPVTEDIAPEAISETAKLYGKPLVVGLSHHTAEVEVREKLSVPEDKWNEVTAKLVSQFDSIEEASLISTCNRFEVYVVTKDSDAAMRDVISFLSDRAGITSDKLMPSLFMHWDKEATWHLLRVAGGLDSLVVGEAHILAQVKAMYKRSTAPASADQPAGSAGVVLQRLFGTCLNAGKMIRIETKIGEGAVSISSAGVELAIMKSPLVLQRNMLDLQVAVVGAGTMSRAFLINLNGNGLTKVVLLNRSPERAEALAAEFPEMKIEIRLMDQFWPTVEEMDLVLTATSSRDPIITKDELNARVWGSDKSRKLMLVDIAVPRNIEAACDELENVFSYNVDDLKEVVAANQAKRKDAVIQAELMLERELSNFQKWQASMHEVAIKPAMDAFKAYFEAAHDEALAEARESGLSDLSEDQLKLVDRHLRHVQACFQRWPMLYISSKGVDKTQAHIADLKALFGLDRPHVVEASTQELAEYAPLLEKIENRLEAELSKRLKTFRIEAANNLSDEQQKSFEELSHRMMDEITRDTKTYLTSHLQDRTKLSAAQVEEIFMLDQYEEPKKSSPKDDPSLIAENRKHIMEDFRARQAQLFGTR